MTGAAVRRPRDAYDVDEAVARAGRRALLAAFFGFGVDMFDVYLPVLALGPAMAFFQPATLGVALQSTLFYAVFALSLIGRPVGATAFGHFADKIGRRRVTIISMAAFAVTTLAIGLLPGYDRWGLGSLVALVTLRFLDGVFLGGEYTGANPLAMEYAPRERRGIWSAYIHVGFPVALTIMSLVTAGLLALMPASSPHSAYVIWGWRIPFFIGALLAAGVCRYYVRHVQESAIWMRSVKPKSPLRELFRRENRRTLVQVFVLMSGVWFTLNAVTSIMPGVLLTIRHVSGAAVTNAQLVAYLALIGGFLSAGFLGQRIGRRTVLILFGILGCTVGPILYFVLVQSGYRHSVALIILVVLINLSALPVWAVMSAYLTERFSTGVRASGYGFAYSAATIVPAFSSFYMLGLASLGMPYEYTELVLFTLGGLLLTIGALTGPETNHVEIG